MSNRIKDTFYFVNLGFGKIIADGHDRYDGFITNELATNPSEVEVHIAPQDIALIKRRNKESIPASPYVYFNKEGDRFVLRVLREEEINEFDLSGSSEHIRSVIKHCISLIESQIDLDYRARIKKFLCMLSNHEDIRGEGELFNRNKSNATSQAQKENNNEIEVTCSIPIERLPVKWMCLEKRENISDKKDTIGFTAEVEREINSLIQEIAPLNFTFSDELSRYITEHDLSHKYRYITGDVEFDWKEIMHNGIAKTYYKAICDRLKLKNRSSGKTVTGFRSNADKMFR